MNIKTTFFIFCFISSIFAAHADPIVPVNVGNLPLAKDSKLVFIVNEEGQSSFVNASGTATLDGSILIASPNGRYSIGTEYLLVNAAGGITGKFNFAEVLNPYFKPTITYRDNQALLSITPNFSIWAGDSNQRAVAGQVDALTDPNGVELDLIYNLAQTSLSQLRSTLSTLSGEQFLGILQVSQKSNDQFLRRLQSFIPISCKECEACPVWWVDANGGHGSFKTTRSHFHSKNWNAYSGLSVPVCNRFIVGAMGNYENNHIHYNLGGHGSIHQGRLGVYGIYCDPCFYVAIDAFGGYGRCNLHRSIRFVDLFDTAKSSFSFASGTFYAEIGSNVRFYRNIIQPFFGWENTCYYRAKAKEHGAGFFNLKAKSQSYAIQSTRLGVHLVNCICYDIGLFADLVWRYNFDYNKRGGTMQFRNFGRSFRVHTDVVSPNVGEFLVTLSKQITNCISCYLQFAGEYSNNYSDYEVGLGLFASF